ncbi:MAG: peptide chain release factor 1 [Candidatus Pacebacteria bacterium]|nr:peptide chain release factor 1 [Candidatus Paceibacterota bacterium]
MQKNLSDLKKEYEDLSQKLLDPKIISDKKQYQEISKRFFLLQKIIEKQEKLNKIEKNIKESQEIIEIEKDPELINLAKEEIEKLSKEKESIQKELNEIKNNDKKKSSSDNIIIEIRAGAGGEEAALFVKDLFEMYKNFALKKGLSFNLISAHPTDLGGFKEIICEVKGKKAGEYFQFESGVHRVQRIPETEKAGRIHTSTVSVAVLPSPPKDIDIPINPNDLKIETFRASGPGGQYVNRRDSAVRITHIPSGIVVSSQNARTQIANRENAMKILKARLYQQILEKEQKKVEKERKTQIGKAMRAEKIRTYNFPQNRITDHRIKKSWGNIEDIFEGNLDRILNDFQK